MNIKLKITLRAKFACRSPCPFSQPITWPLRGNKLRQLAIASRDRSLSALKNGHSEAAALEIPQLHVPSLWQNWPFEGHSTNGASLSPSRAQVSNWNCHSLGLNSSRGLVPGQLNLLLAFLALTIPLSGTPKHSASATQNAHPDTDRRKHPAPRPLQRAAKLTLSVLRILAVCTSLLLQIYM